VVEVGLGVLVEAVGSASALITLGSMVVGGTNRMVVGDMVAAGPDPDAGAELEHADAMRPNARMARARTERVCGPVIGE